MGFAISDLAFGIGGSSNYGDTAANTEKARQEAIAAGMGKINNAFAGFTPQFYQQRAQAYDQYALPQLADQYRQAQSQVGFGLANKGLVKSSAAQKQWSDLFRTNATAKQGIVDAGTAQAQDLQKQVASQQQGLINQLYQTADPGTAGQAATQTAAQLQQPGTFAPIANQFSNLINQYYLASILNQRSPVVMPQGSGSGSQFAPLPASQY